MKKNNLHLAIAISFLLASCSPSSQPVSRFDKSANNWASIGQNPTEDNYSKLEQINADNVGDLGLAWSLDLDGEGSLEATPLAIDGVLYFSGREAVVYAVDAKNGKLLWRYDPEAGKVDPDRLRLMFHVNRGVAYANGLVFVGSFDGRLIALDAKTGAVRWSARTFDLKSKKYSNGAPRVFKNMVLIGNGGGDYGERGYVTAYDQSTGRQMWRFFTVPGNPADGFEDDAMKMAAKTWSGEWWKTGTGGTVWNGMTFDAELNRVYIGVGNAAPYDAAIRNPKGGDNLFIASIVALDADTGKYVWHYQVNPNESWDHKATPNMILADLVIEGRSRKVLMQAPTSGFFYVIDRLTGKLISAEKLGKVTWASHIDLKTGRPVEAPNIRMENGPSMMWPSSLGTHNWQPMAFSRQTGLVYIPYMQVGQKLGRDPGSTSGGMSFEFMFADANDGKGRLLAWDPVAQKARWSLPRVSLWNGGVMATGGNLVFQGTEDGRFQAVNATTGKLLWDFAAHQGIMGSAATYTVGGVQYVSILAGYGGGAAVGSSFLKGGWKWGDQPKRLLTFKLGGKAKLPDDLPPRFSVRSTASKDLVLDDRAIAGGLMVYARSNCTDCHGANAQTTAGTAPDLRESAVAADRAALAKVLKEGTLSGSGMPRFSELTEKEISDLHTFIRAAAREAAGGRKADEKAAASRR